MKYKRIKIKTYIIGTILLILFLIFNIINIYIKNTSKLFKTYSTYQINRLFDNNIISSLKDINSINFNSEFYKVYYNDNNEIIYLDQDINITNYYIDRLSNIINNKLKDNKLVINVPYNLKQNIVFYNLVPKIYLNVNNINSMIAYINTSVKEYGINNVIIQNYINIEINYLIEGALQSKENKYSYKYLINSKIITGKIPTIYNKEYLATSEIFNIPIE